VQLALSCTSRAVAEDLISQGKVEVHLIIGMYWGRCFKPVKCILLAAAHLSSGRGNRTYANLAGTDAICIPPLRFPALGPPLAVCGLSFIASLRRRQHQAAGGRSHGSLRQGAGEPDQVMQGGRSWRLFGCDASLKTGLTLPARRKWRQPKALLRLCILARAAAGPGQPDGSH